MSDPGRASGSEPYRRFRQVFFDEPHRDGPDMLALDALDPTERRAAERELLDRIDDPAVSTAAMDGLAHLRSQAALGPLREIMQAGRDRRAVHAAMALWRIDRDEAAFRTLCRVVEDRPWLRRDPARVDAAAMLRQIERPAALVPLIDALDDRDIAVRANAKLAVRERLGLHAEADALKRGEITVEELRRAARIALARVEGGSP